MSSLSRFTAPRLTLLLGVVAVLASSAHAGPTGPSARRAAQLKKAAPGWLSHYLPDDRYKIEGKVWKYVATDLDTYYHRPDSPNMLRQPADRVIGFASAKDAEEAGYKPDPSDGTASMAMAGSASSLGGISGGGVAKGGSVRLSDGSSITLPAGWTRQGGPLQRIHNGTMSMDILMHPKTQNMVLLLSLTQPGVNLGQQLSTTSAQTTLNRLGGLNATGGQITTNPAQSFQNFAATAKVRPATWAGLRGVSMSSPAMNQGGFQTGSLIMVARGSKMYAYMAMRKGSQSAPGTRAMLASFRPR